LCAQKTDSTQGKETYPRVKTYLSFISLPVRFGNNLPASIGANLQIGFTFN
jgi:hypothetical protein